MHWYQMGVLILLALPVGVNISRHGEKPKLEYSAWAAILRFGFMLWMLMEGGFF